MTASTLPDEGRISYFGWRVLAGAVIGLAFSPGPMVFGAIGLFVPSIQASFNWNRGEILLSLTLFNVAALIASPYTGRLIDRLGVRAVLFPSLLLLALGFAACSYLAGSLPALYVIAFLWGGLTVGTQSISYTKLIAGWFVQHRGLAIGVAAAGLGAGYSIVPLIAAQLLARLAWQPAFAMLGLIVATVPFLINLAVARPKPVAAIVDHTKEGLTLREAVRTKEFAFMASSILLASAALTGVVPHLPLMALDNGFPAAQAAVAASVYGLSTIFGRVLVGWLADRLFVPRVGALFFTLSMLGFALAGVYGSHASFAMQVFLSLVIGLGFGAESDLIAILIGLYFGERSFGAIYGWLLSAFLVGASAGPALFGFGHDRFGSYAIPMLVATGVMLGSVLLMLALGKARLTAKPTPAAETEAAV
jgi:MFS family permease